MKLEVGLQDLLRVIKKTENYGHLTFTICIYYRLNCRFELNINK